MIRRDTIGVYLVGSLVILPAVFALAAYQITRNPALRPLGITIEKMVEAGQIKDRSLIIAEITFGTEAKTQTSLAQYREAMSNSFAMFQTEAHVRFREVEGRSDIQVRYIVGGSTIGPYPISQAAKGIKPAVAAEKLSAKQRGMIERMNAASRENDGFFRRIFSD